MSQMVGTGTFKNQTLLKKALASLRQVGIREHSVSMILPADLSTSSFTIQAGTKSVQGILASPVIFGSLCALLFAAQMEGVLSYQNLGVSYQGRWVAAFAGFGIGTLIGALAGWLIGRKLPQYQVAWRSKSENDSESLLLGVVVDEKIAEKVNRVLVDRGAKDVRVVDKQFQEESGL